MTKAALNAEWCQTSEMIAAIYNTVRDPKKKPKPFTGDDFNPTLARKKRPKVGIEALSVMMRGRRNGFPGATTNAP